MSVHDIILGYRPREWQKRLHREKKRFSIAVVHRRAGKTYAAMFELIHEALLSKKHLAYIAPYLNQGRKVMWGPIKEVAVKIPHTTIREVDSSIEFANGSVIRILGADNSDSIRGMGFDGCVADEFQNFDKNVLPSVVMPTLAGRDEGRGGWLLLLGTPTGIDPLTETFDRVSKDPSWATWKFDVLSTGVLTPEEIEIQKGMCVGNSFRLEWMCDFDAGSPGQLITGDEVEVAFTRNYLPEHYRDSAKIMACDIARQGDDASVICRRQGLQCWDFDSWHESDLAASARKIRDACYQYCPDALFIDGGGIGAGVVDMLRDWGVPVIEVQFGGKASDMRFLNKRAEMWIEMALWLRRGGRIPFDPTLKMELVSPTHFTNDKGQTQLESKDDLKKRGLSSPDKADALAMTFFMPVWPSKDLKENPPRKDWDPFG